MSFNKNSGPGTRNHNQQPSFGNQPPPPPPSSSSSWFNGGSVNPGGNQSGSAAPAIPSHNQDLKRTRSPPALSTYKEVLQKSTTVLGSQRTKSPPLVYQRNHPDRGFGPLSETKRLSTRLDNSHVWPQPSADLYKPEARATNQSDLPVPKRSRLPFTTLNDPGLRGNNSSVLNDTQSHFVPQRSKSPLHVYQRNHPDKGFVPSSETKRPSVSPSRLSTRVDYSDVWTQPYTDLDKPDAPATNLPVPKRSSSPFPTLNEPGSRGNNTSLLDDTQRELQAKAKRMARFKNELSQPDPNETGNRNQKPQQVDQRKIKGEGSDMNEDQDSSSTVIIGYCADMCPEQERAERERKGDLDQYERLDGDRNQTTGSLAVKKYTRTAEREAALIRPMEILQKTIDYLLKLLDQPYDDRFLGLYNFLWDRMRAVRMDLRMQHIFNLGAITMLEQMIRLHIIAMHELCEYTKGEGFSEGFDAHLNIEQMNKTSVELLQLYDDHRKKGINVPTETEFRGYYALLKLDKHPGYKVEPSELSLDLAKMTPGIRQAADVLFARNVARACRTGNFVAFFRLVRKASYLQACLMHAHFGKLRTLALASLHNGLQNNQGIPLSQVAKWLGMEEENMEDLLEYHGFCIKEFDEAYMVKSGQFLNLEKEYPLKCSKLVHLKRSTTVVQDVSSSPLITSFTPNDPKVDHLSTQEKSTVIRKETTQIFPKSIDNKTTDFGSILSVKNDMHLQPIFTTPVAPVVASSLPRDIFKNSNYSPKSPKSVEKPSLLERKFRNSLEKHQQSDIFTISPHVAPEKVVVEETLPDVRMDSFVEEDLQVQPVFLQNLETENVIQEMPNENENEIEMDTSVDDEVAEAKLKLIFRLWRRRAFIKKELREKRQLAANAALSSLSLGPPMWHYKEQLKAPVDFNIDRAMCERYEKQEQLWSTLNVSNIVAPTLGQLCKYPKLICWKLLFSSLDQGSWLQHKLMPENIGYDDDDLIASSPNVSIWKKLDYKKPTNDCTCFITVVKNVQSDNLIEETVLGASAVMFLASEGISWEAQKTRLFKLISLVPYGSCLPLLILSGSNWSTVVENLGLNEVDKSKISCFSVVPLGDGYLTNGLEWLASQSPLQPVVSHVKTRELILKNLKVMRFDDSLNTTPQQCICIINEAVEESVKEVNAAAKSNPVCWPCPEISLLNGPDIKILESYLPSVGWSSGARIGCLIEALRNCKLPKITNNLSWCCNIDIDIEKQKVELEQFLVSYLSPVLGLQLAQKETLILIQKCVGLELCGWSYYLVPKWAMIFRRVFNWQLMSLSNGPFSMAYVLEQQDENASVSFAEEESYNKMTSPSLDEMIQVSCFQHGPNLELKAALCEDEMVVNSSDEVEEEMNYVENENKNANGNESVLNDSERSLSRLLEKCCVVQDIIDQKLSVYF